MVPGGTTATGETYTSVGALVATAGGTNAIGVALIGAPPVTMTCEDGVRTGGVVGVGSLVTGVMTVPSPSGGGVVWAIELLVVHRSIVSPIASIGLNFIGNIMG